MSVHVDDIFVDGNPETLMIINENNKRNFSMQESCKVKKFISLYNEWGRDTKGTYAKITIEKDIKKLVEGYKSYNGSDVKIQKTPGEPGTTLIKIYLEEPYNIDKYRSFLGQLMWYTNNMVPDVANAARELSVHMSHPMP